MYPKFDDYIHKSWTVRKFKDGYCQIIVPEDVDMYKNVHDGMIPKINSIVDDDGQRIRVIWTDFYDDRNIRKYFTDILKPTFR